MKIKLYEIAFPLNLKDTFLYFLFMFVYVFSIRNGIAYCMITEDDINTTETPINSIIDNELEENRKYLIDYIVYRRGIPETMVKQVVNQFESIFVKNIKENISSVYENYGTRFHPHLGKIYFQIMGNNEHWIKFLQILSPRDNMKLNEDNIRDKDPIGYLEYIVKREWMEEQQTRQTRQIQEQIKAMEIRYRELTGDNKINEAQNPRNTSNNIINEAKNQSIEVQNHIITTNQTMIEAEYQIIEANKLIIEHQEKKIEELKSDIIEIENLTQNIENQTQTIEMQKQEITTLKFTIGDKDKEINQANENINKINQDKDNLLSNFNELTQLAENLQRNIQNQKQEIEDLTRDIQNQKLISPAFDKSINDQTQTIDAKNQENDNIKQERDNLNNNLKEAIHAINNQKDEIKKRDLEINKRNWEIKSLRSQVERNNLRRDINYQYAGMAAMGVGIVVTGGYLLSKCI